jgi:uncharacterized protein GlcG (DUF336 family)
MRPAALAVVLAIALVFASCHGPEHGGPKPRDESGAAATSGCEMLPSSADLKRYLAQAPSAIGNPGGLFGGRMEWAAVVDRSGRICSVAVATDDPSAVWPGSQAIAKAKAYTANAFSTDAAPLSTARLYTLAQPGHSLYGAANGNPIDPACLSAPEEPKEHRVCGGTIVFGGGVPLYRSGRRVGGLGVSGDTACADHEIAKRIRAAAGLEPDKGAAADDISYSSVDGPSAFTHPLCANTWRNGTRIGDEAPAVGY